jgi:hypothetical protein
MKTLIIKSLLTSLCQREAIYLSLEKRPMARSQRLIEGKGRFSNNDALFYAFLSKSLKVRSEKLEVKHG